MGLWLWGQGCALLGRRYFHQGYFERRYRRPDPWGYHSAYEQTKYERTLAVLRPRYRRILEVGCSEGRFTVRLAERGDEVWGVDLSPTAVERARARCRPFPHVRVRRMDVLKGRLGTDFDLIVCAELLYYLGRTRTIARLRDRLVRALAAQGELVLVHPWPASRRLHRPFHRCPRLQLVEEHLHRDARRPYAISRFRLRR